jgi:hypothetical protein
MERLLDIDGAGAAQAATTTRMGRNDFRYRDVWVGRRVTFSPLKCFT